MDERDRFVSHTGARMESDGRMETVSDRQTDGNRETGDIDTINI